MQILDDRMIIQFPSFSGDLVMSKLGIYLSGWWLKNHLEKKIVNGFRITYPIYELWKVNPNSMVPVPTNQSIYIFSHSTTIINHH